jgi:diketogulonate reductase-like aldo/keto reductase
MEKLYASGKTRSIGVSNWTIAGLQTLLSYAVIPPVVNQVEIHPYLPNTALLAFCKSHSILPVAYSPLGSQHQVDHSLSFVSSDPVLTALAKRKGVSFAQVLIAWGLKRGYAVLPKSSNAERIKSNFEVVDLSEDEFEEINEVAKRKNDRFVNLKDTFGYNVWPEGTN